MTYFVLIDNALVKEEEAKISINQRSSMFGDGIFETCRIFNGTIYNFEAHLTRIKAGLKALKFSKPLDDLEAQAYALIEKNQITDGMLRISISRGIGSLGYLPTYESDCLTVIQTSQVRKSPIGEINIGIGETRKPSGNAVPVSCKTMQALPFTLNKIEAQEQGLFDCVMLSQHGYVSETSAANIFWVKGGVIYTPSEKCDILLGTIRRKILDNFEVIEVEKGIEALQKADEVFLTNVGGLVLAVDGLVVGGDSVTFGNERALKMLEWVMQDVEKSCFTLTS